VTKLPVGHRPPVGADLCKHRERTISADHRRSDSKIARELSVSETDIKNDDAFVSATINIGLVLAALASNISVRFRG
jgi:hypothetical protein